MHEKRHTSVAMDASSKTPTPKPALSGEPSETIQQSCDLSNTEQQAATVIQDENPPKFIGRYRILRSLGAGTFGCVWLAEDEFAKRHVAVKLLQHQTPSEELLAEARILAKVEHPAIIPLFDIGQTASGQWFFVFKFLSGCSLAERLSQARLKSDEIIGVAIILADALAWAHSQGIVHRDLKPSNILLDEHDNPYICDFGLALQEHEQSHRHGEFSGTLAYMAPEQVRGEVPHLDGRADIWAVGVILYEMLTGRRPFNSSNWQDLMEEIKSREPRPPRMIDPTIPLGLERITLRCLAKTVTERYPTATDIASELREIQKSRSCSPSQLSEKPTPKHQTSHRGVQFKLTAGCFSVAVAVNLLLLVGFVFFYPGNRPDPDSFTLTPNPIDLGESVTRSDPVGSGSPGAATPGFGGIEGRIVIAESDKSNIPPPDVKLIPVGKAPVDPYFCAAAMPIMNQALIVDADSLGIKNTFFYLEKKPMGGKAEIASQSTWPTSGVPGTLVLNQKNCTFEPHAMILKVGVELMVQSQDSIVHSFRGNPLNNGSFNISIPPARMGGKGITTVNLYKRPEKTPMPISCATHNWMSGYQLPLDHPYAAVSDADGKFTISDLPSGNHTFKIWHEVGGNLMDYDVEVKADEVLDLGNITIRLSTEGTYRLFSENAQAKRASSKLAQID